MGVAWHCSSWRRHDPCIEPAIRSQASDEVILRAPHHLFGSEHFPAHAALEGLQQLAYPLPTVGLVEVIPDGMDKLEARRMRINGRATAPPCASADRRHNAGRRHHLHPGRRTQADPHVGLVQEQLAQVGQQLHDGEARLIERVVRRAHPERVHARFECGEELLVYVCMRERPHPCLASGAHGDVRQRRQLFATPPSEKGGAMRCTR
mmetsp:Transcript_38448/g.87347  ORF Transcript_38448/g.87347 Transcript_38448/m.87347 type:complete len:207 (-) Transcript_38448:1244-1864(-)